MKNFTLLLVLLAGCLSGYFIGSYRGNAALVALSAAKQAAQQEMASSDQTRRALEERLTSLDADHRRDLSQLESRYQRQLASLNKTLQDKTQMLKGLSATLTDNQHEIERLHDLAHNTADGDQKQKLQFQIAQLEHTNRNLQSDIKGINCLTTPVPTDILQQLPGVQP